MGQGKDNCTTFDGGVRAWGYNLSIGLYTSPLSVCVFFSKYRANICVCLSKSLNLYLSYSVFSAQSYTTNRAKSKYTTADVIPISNLIRINATSGYACVHTKLSWRTHTAFENLQVPNCLSFLGQSKFLSELEGGRRAKQSVAVGCSFWQFLDHCDAEGLVLLRLGWGGGRAEHLIFTGRGEKHYWRQFSAEGHTS